MLRQNHETAGPSKLRSPPLHRRLRFSNLEIFLSWWLIDAPSTISEHALRRWYPAIWLHWLYRIPRFASRSDHVPEEGARPSKVDARPISCVHDHCQIARAGVSH